MKRLVVVFCAVAIMGSIGCSGGSGSKDSGSSSQGPNTLFLAVKSTTPTFTATTSLAPAFAASRSTMPSISDPAMMLAFQMLRDYNYPADEGKVDMTNIYKVMWEAGGKLDGAERMVSPIAEATDSSLSPYLFSDFLGHTYTGGGTQAETLGYGGSIAYKKVGMDKYMLASYKWAPDATQQITIGTIQTLFNDTTKDVSLIFAQTVRYPVGSSVGGAGGGFSTRMRIEGNSGTHSFEIKLSMVTANGNMPSLVGKGISQGSGNFFLMRSGSDYYCIPAGATETTIGTITPTALSDVSSDCAAYTAWVSAATPYDPATDVPKIDLTDFDHGVHGSPVKYEMF